ncbi:MAG: PAS domain S-box protein [Balneolaceae bacterium]
MKQSTLQILKECSKNETAFEKIKKLFEDIQKKADRYENYLDLLERSIRNDYDSIMITELELEKPGPKIVYVNDGFTRITGYSREEVIGKTPRILQGPKTDRAVLDKLKKRLLEGNAFFGHTVNYRKDGTEFVNQWDIHPLTDENGEVTHWVSYQHDITERKRSEKTLMDTRIDFDNLKEESQQTLVDVDIEGNITMANKSFRKLTGYDYDELRNMKIWSLVPETHADKLKEKFSSLQQDEIDKQAFELLLKKKNGEEVEVNVTTRLLTSDRDKMIRFSFRNRSRQKRIMRMLEKKTEGFKRIFEKSTDFTYKIRIEEDRADFPIAYISDNFSLITGIDSNKAIGLSMKELIHEDDWEKVQKHLNRVAGGHSNTEIYRIRISEDEFIPMIDYAKPIKDNEGKVKAIKGSTSLEISSEQLSYYGEKSS